MNRILVVDGDDDVAIRLLYTDELTEEGYDVISRQGGPGLLELIGTKRPDLVVVDITPRENDGRDLFQDIRNLYDDLPVIMSTLYSNGQPDQGLTVNDLHLEKSSNLRELKRTIRKTFRSNEHFPMQGMSDCSQVEMSPL